MNKKKKSEMKKGRSKDMAVALELDIPVNKAFVLEEDKLDEFKKETLSKEDIKFIMTRAEKFKNQIRMQIIEPDDE